MREMVIRALLSKQFYDSNKDYITDKHLADKEPVRLYHIIKKFYKYNDTDIATTANLRQLFAVESRGKISESSAAAYYAFLDVVEEAEVAEAVVANIVRDLYKQYMLEEAQQLLASTDDADEAGQKALEILNKVFTGNLLPEDENYEFVDFSSDYFQESIADRYRWTFHHPTLKQHTRGIGQGVFCIVGGTPNSGKTHFCISSVFQPGGFLEQGAKVLYFANEEPGAVTALRGMASWSGVDKTELENEDGVKLADILAKFHPLAENARVVTEKYMDVSKLEAVISKVRPDIVVVDMADKVSANGEFSREDQRLAYLYLKLRDFAKVYGCAVIATSQGSAEAEGKKFWTADLLVGSKTAKNAEGDLIITIGKENKEVDDMFRQANIVKNKLTGIHRSVVYRLDPEKSRILV